MQLNSLAEQMVAVLASVVPPHSATYCSAPISSGKLYLEWFKRNSIVAGNVDEAQRLHSDSHYRDVIEPNCQSAGLTVQRLRSAGRLVIDPTAFGPVGEWSQEDYRVF